MNKRKIFFLTIFLFFCLFCNSFTVTSSSLNFEKNIKSKGDDNRIALIVGANPDYSWIGKSAISFNEAINTSFWDDIKLLVGNDASKINIINEIKNIEPFSKRGNNIFLFYFIGHSESSFFRCGDGDIIYDAEFQYHFSKILSKNTYDGKIGSNKIIFILDSCYSGRLGKNKLKINQFSHNILLNKIFYNNNFVENFFSNNIKNQENVDIFNNGFNRKNKYLEEPYDGTFQNLVKSGRIIITSCKKYQKCWSNIAGLSYFTYYLIKALKDTSIIETAFKEAKINTKEHAWNIRKELQAPQIADWIRGEVRIK